MADETPADFEEIPSYDDAPSDDIVRQCWEDYETAKAYRKKFDKDWARYYLLYAGKHWSGEQAPWMATPVINLTFSVIQTIVPIMTDGRPQIAVVARKPEFDKVGSVLQTLTECVWEAQDMDVKLPKVMTNTLIFGNCFVKVLWDKTLNGGLGDIKIVEVDPSHIFTSPHARTLEDASYVIHAENMPRSYVKRLIPEWHDNKDGPEAPELTMERTVTSQNEGINRSQANNTVQATDGSGAFQSWAEQSTGRQKGEDLVTVLEKWERADDGSITQTVIVNRDLIFTRPSPFSHGMFPFVQFVDHPHTWSLWAMGEVQQVEKLQIEINRRRGHIQDILRWTAHPMLIVDPAAVAEWDQIKPRPNLVIPSEGGMQGIGWLMPPQVPSSLFQSNQMDKDDFDTVLGKVDILTGKAPSGIEAGVAIDMLQEAANVRMRLKVRHMEQSIRKLGELIVSMIQEFYTTERVFAVAGREAFKSEKPLTHDTYLRINQAQTFLPDGNPDPGTMSNRIPPLEEARFDVRVGAGSTLPVSKTSRLQLLLALYDRGLADAEALLKASGLNDWDEILARIQLREQQMMAAQAGAQPQGEQMSEQDVDTELQGGAGVPPMI